MKPQNKKSILIVALALLFANVLPAAINLFLSDSDITIWSVIAFTFSLIAFLMFLTIYLNSRQKIKK
jgi:uncharacterized membrane protein YjfL (UPF0719 family)